MLLSLPELRRIIVGLVESRFSILRREKEARALFLALRSCMTVQEASILVLLLINLPLLVGSGAHQAVGLADTVRE